MEIPSPNGPASAAALPTPPRWDLSPIFPSLDSPEFAAGFAGALAALHDLKALFDREGIAGGKSGASAEDERASFESVVTAYNAAIESINTVRGYIALHVSTDSRNAAAQAKLSEIRREMVTLSLLDKRLAAWVGTIDVDRLLASSELARTHEFAIKQLRIQSERLMAPGEEDLAASLHLAGGGAWGKLHGDITSQLIVSLDGVEQPMSVIRGLASNEDRETRRKAYEAELAAWERVSIPLCAAMNSIKHEANVLAGRRGWGDVLNVALYNNHIDRPTLDAMMTAARAAFPDFRRYMRAKARVVSGEKALAWYDLFAPLGDSTRTWAWPEAEAFIEKQFGAYSDKMRQFAVRAFREKWIDAEPRPGKRDGAFCMGIRPGESRIMQNYKPAFDGVGTLAHELGHGYHNLCLADRTNLQRQTPSTLAETASIFCETIARGAALKDASKEDQLAIVEDSLQGSCQVVVDITSRFLFEQRVLERRKDRELSVSELCDIMRGAQLETYGDGLNADLLHPYMWAVKGHYYGSSFYNFPYMFGLLFGLGLYAIYKREPDSFYGRYDDLLSRTGMAGSVELAQGFGIDIRDVAFWNASFDQIRAEVSLFEQLTSAA